jgi:hypothetical protein
MGIVRAEGNRTHGLTDEDHEQADKLRTYPSLGDVP